MVRPYFRPEAVINVAKPKKGLFVAESICPKLKLIGLSARNLIVTSQKSKSKAISDKEKEKFQSYFKFRRNLEELKCFQLLALLRGERIKALSVSWDLDGYDWKRIKNYKIRESLWCLARQI